MSTLLAIAFPDQYAASGVMGTLRRLQEEKAIELEDAVAVSKDAQGKLELDQQLNLTTVGARRGAIWGGLLGLLFLAPVAGFAIGAAGALLGKVTDYGIDDAFAGDLVDAMPPNSSAVLMLIREASPDETIAELKPYGGTVLRTSLSEDAERRLGDAPAGSSR